MLQVTGQRPSHTASAVPSSSKSFPHSVLSTIKSPSVGAALDVMNSSGSIEKFTFTGSRWSCDSPPVSSGISRKGINLDIKTVTLEKRGSAIPDKKLYKPNDGVFSYLGYGVRAEPNDYYMNDYGKGLSMVACFATDAAVVEIRLLGVNSIFELYVDGLRVTDASTKTDTSGAGYIYNVEFKTARPREFRLVGVNLAFGGIVVSQTHGVWQYNPKPKLVWQLGDSYTFGTGATQPSCTDTSLVCESLGYEYLAAGIGGSGWLSTEGRLPQLRAEECLSRISRTPDYCILALGYNDKDSTRKGDIFTNFVETVRVIRERAPFVRIFAYSPATPLGDTAGLADVRTQVKSACAATGVELIDVTNWINADNKSRYTGSDNVHPTPAGFDYRGGRLVGEFLRLLK